MTFSPLEISGCYLIQQKVFPDTRGYFREWFRTSEIADIDPDFSIQQANFSNSIQGVIRGMHFSISPQGQSKIVTCTSGSVSDVLVDFRVGSPTYLSVQRIDLDETSGQSIFIASGVGHGFQSTSSTASMMYVTSSIYSPNFEKSIFPLDASLRIDWPIMDPELVVLSESDRNAVSLKEALSLGILPTF